jgi:hypothetical protein
MKNEAKKLMRRASARRSFSFPNFILQILFPVWLDV